MATFTFKRTVVVEYTYEIEADTEEEAYEAVANAEDYEADKKRDIESETELISVAD